MENALGYVHKRSVGKQAAHKTDRRTARNLRGRLILISGGRGEGVGEIRIKERAERLTNRERRNLANISNRLRGKGAVRGGEEKP